MKLYHYVMNNIHRLDFNLLKTLVVILEEKNLTRTGDKIGLSQSAISHSLRKLRDFFDDQLVIRSGNGLELTEKGEQLKKPLRKWLNELEYICSGAVFDPAISSRTFKIGCMDVIEQMIAPNLVRHIRRIAPFIKIQFTRLDDKRLYDQLTSGEVDLVIGVDYYNEIYNDIVSQTLYREIFSCLVRKQHPILKKKPTIKEFVKYPHIVVSIGDRAKNSVDAALAQENLSRDLKYIISNFSSAPYFVEGDDVIMTGPTRFLKFCAKRHNVMVFPCPVKQHEFEVMMFWAQKYQDDDVNKWLREVFASVTVNI